MKLYLIEVDENACLYPWGKPIAKVVIAESVEQALSLVEYNENDSDCFLETQKLLVKQIDIDEPKVIYTAYID